MQTHTRRHPSGHSCGYTDSLRQGSGPSSLYIQDSPQTQTHNNLSPPPLRLSEAESHKCSTHPTLSMFTNTHLHTSPQHQHCPSLCPAALPRSQPPYQPHRSPAGLTGCSLPTCSTHTLVPLAGHARGSSPNTSIALLPARYPHPHPGPPMPGWSSLGFACESTPNKPCTAGLGKAHRLSSRSMRHWMVQMQH